MKISTRIIDYDLKCCMVVQKCKNNITGRKRGDRGANNAYKSSLKDNILI